MSKYLIQSQSGIRIDVNKGQRIEIIDVAGRCMISFIRMGRIIRTVWII